MAPTPFPSAGVPYPLTAACQQLCTIALISRGSTSQHYGAGVNAGGSNGLPLYQSGGGRWVNNAAWLNPDEALKQPPPDGVAPGAVYEWTPATGPHTDGSQIAFVLRAPRPGAGQGSWNGIQFFDTGGVAIPNRASGVTVRTDGKGNYDDPWAVQPFSGPAAFTGIGILPVSSPQAPDLQTAVNHMRMAWPLGFARILVRLRAGNQLLYASPLLSMCTANPSCNFSIARYLW